MHKKLLPVFTFAKIGIRRAFRDKTAIFFVFLFPLIFLVIFGTIFGKNGGVSFKVAIIDNAQTSFSKQFVNDLEKNKIFKVDTKATTEEAAQEKMKRGQLDATIILPEGFGAEANGKTIPSGQAKVVYTQNGQSAAQTLTSVLQAIFAEINGKFVKTETPFTVTSEQLNARSLRPFDYTFAGLLGFSIIGLGIFGPVNVFPELKKQGILRRLHTTPLKVWQYFTANVMSQSVVGLMSIFIQFVAAMLFFHLKLAGNVVELTLFIVFGIIAIFGIGLAIGGWAKDQNQAAPLANLIVFPMIFLSGTFFPRYLMPEWLQKVSNVSPLTPIIEGIRLIATEGNHLTQLGPQLGLIAVWTVIIYAIAFRVFRWE